MDAEPVRWFWLGDERASEELRSLSHAGDVDARKDIFEEPPLRMRYSLASSFVQEMSQRAMSERLNMSPSLAER